MAIQYPNIHWRTFDESNPLLVGMERGQALGQSAMMFPKKMQEQDLLNAIKSVQAKYAEPKAEQELQKETLENKWYEPNIKSEIGLRGAQAGLAGQQSKYYGKNVESEIGLRNAQTQAAQAESGMNKLKLQYMQHMLSGQGAGGGAGGGNYTPWENGGAGGQAGSAQGGAPQQAAPTQSVYGIDTPQPTQTDIVNKMLLGVDTYGPKAENAKKQQQDQYEQFQKGLAESVQEAQAANNMNQAISVFNNAMDKSFYKGSRLGHLGSSGLLSPPGNLDPEQTADRAALQMLPAAITTLKDAMGQSKFSNLDMNMATKMKFDRTMNDDTRAVQSQWVNGVNDRMQEKSKFLKTVANPQSGLTKTDADMLWTAYQQEFPLISQDGKTFQGSNLGNWPLYTTPKAIASIKQTGTYRPSKSERNVFMMQVPDGKGGYVIAPVKKGRVESAFSKGARPV